MPQTQILVFRPEAGEPPLLEWLEELEIREPRAHAKCLQRILLLAERGFELRRPHADLLERGIYELRSRIGRVNYRVLYFFVEKTPNVAVVTHGFTKEGEVPQVEIDRAVAWRKLVIRNQEKHTAEFEE